MKAIINHLSFEFKSILRDKTLLLMNYLFPLTFYFMMAAIMPSINPDFTKTMIPSMIVFTIIVSTLLGMPNPIVSSKEKGIYRSYKIYGVPLRSVLLIPVITTMIHITIVSLIIFITGSTIFNAEMPQNPLSFIGIYFITLFAFSGLGLLVGVCSPNGRITVLLAQLIFLPSMLLGGIMLPTNILSETMQQIARILPSTPAMNIFYTVSYNHEALYSVSGSIIVLILGGLLSYFLAAYLFTWDPKENKQARNIIGIAALLPYIISIFIF